MKRIIPLILALLLLASIPAQAASNVIFVGGAEEFVFMPGSVYSDSDLFENFKGVMPGDVITQRIIVKNNSGTEVRIFLRADPVEDKQRDFLSRLNLPSTVYNMLPYIISLVVLVIFSKNSAAPKAEGIPYDKGSR
jgi:hypothetical protein